jgi:hypothetical protein
MQVTHTPIAFSRQANKLGRRLTKAARRAARSHARWLIVSEQWRSRFGSLPPHLFDLAIEIERAYRAIRRTVSVARSDDPQLALF